MVYKSPFPPVHVSNESLPKKILHAIWKHGELNPSQHAIITASDPAKSLTFHELHKQVHSVRAFLRKKGFGQGEVACLVLSNCVEWAVFELGAMAAGGAVSGASALFTDYELSRQFSDSCCSVILTDEDHLAKVMQAAKQCDRIKTIICIRNSTSESAPLPSGISEWNELLALDPGSMAALPYSSGTTGSPKRVMLSHRNIGTMVDTIISHFDREVFGVIGPQDHDWHNEYLLLNLPFYHMFAFTLLHVGLVSGATVVVMSKFEPRVYLSAIQTFRPRVLFTVPPILLFLAKDPLVKKYDCSSLEFIFVAAAPTGRDLCLEFLARHRNVKFLCQGYGMTEYTMVSHLPVLKVKNHFMGVGQLISNFEQKIIDSTGKEVAVGELGEVCVRSPTVMLGYLNRPEATAETIDKEGWLHTGDIGYIDSEGRTYIVDRLKELIKVKGFQVAPAELEDLLLSHPLIRDAAVIGIPDYRVGELVRAYVVRADKSLSENDVVRFVAVKVSSYKHITGGVKFVKMVPKAPSGKILRRFLRDEAAKEMKAKI